VEVKFDPHLSPDLFAKHESRRVDHSVFVYGPKLARLGSKSWRLTVAHELVHSHLRHFRAPLEAAEKRMGAGFLAWYEDTEEEVADRLEVVLARLLPPPSWLG
jgi:hypothetical protein